MFGMKDHWANSKRLFEEQFEPEGSDFLYRRSLKGSPIRVTQRERQHFIDDYARRLRFTTWGLFTSLIVFTGAVVSWTVATGADLPDIAMYIGIGAIALVSVAYSIWVHGAPARELARRTPVGRERSRAEMRRLTLKRMTYGQLATAAFAAAVLPFTLRSHPDLFHGWSRLWLVFSAAIILLAAVQAVRKWRFETRNGSDGT